LEESGKRGEALRGLTYRGHNRGEKKAERGDT